jgi:hypothetical protein
MKNDNWADCCVECYKVERDDLPKASRLMNENCPDAGFKSQIVDVLPVEDKTYVVVVVQICGSYPYVTNEWNSVIVKDWENEQES